MLNTYNLNKDEIDILNNQIVQKYQDNLNHDVQQNEFPQFHNRYRSTVEMWLSEQKCLIPKYWIYNLEKSNSKISSLIQSMEDNYMPIPYHWHDDYMTVFDKAYFGIIPEIDDHTSDEQDEDGFTVAMILAISTIEIPKQWYHKPEIQNKYGFTVAMYLAMNDQEIPSQWNHKQTIRCTPGYTVAMFQAQNDKIPDKCWQHNKYLRYKYSINNNCQMNHNYYYTVQNILQSKNVEVPEEWSYPVLNICEDNQAMIDAKNGIIPKLEDNNPSYQNKIGQTVAMILVSKGIIPPRQWMHDIYLNNILNMTSLKTIFKDKQLHIPEHWQNEQDMSIFDKAFFGIIPDINGHQPEEKDENVKTIAIILTQSKIDVPKQWYHDPQIQDQYGNSVAMYQAQQAKIPDKQWEHKSELQNNNGQTVAMFLAQNSIIPSKQWQHDILLHDKHLQTVGIILASKGIVPPDQWMHDITLCDDYHRSIQICLQNFQYIYQNNKFIFNYKIQIINDTCQICFNKGQQKFIDTICRHQICLSCFRQLIQNRNTKYCPICKKENWYYQIQECKYPQAYLYIQ